MSEQTLPGAVVTPSGRHAGQIIGYRRSGAPIRVVAGGSGEGEGAPATGDGGGSSGRDGSANAGTTDAGGDGGTTAGTTPDPTGQPPAGSADAGTTDAGAGGSTAGTTGTDDPGQQTGKPTPASKRPLTDFPPELQDYIRDLRKQAGDGRVAAKTANTRAEEIEGKLQSFLEGFSQVLGLTPEPAEELTPEQLTAQLTSTRDEHRKTTVELATYRAAMKADPPADAEALLDSRSFASKIHALDPTAADFGEQVAAAITEAVEANPKFRAEPLAGLLDAPSGGVFSGGTGGQPSPESMSVEDHLRLINAPAGS
ncbi:hypothetical protein JNW90_10610 [Micromonospora sp. STR1s_5]|nr:hypothetical protein [Micromonospora sp. STR1s_5]